MTGNTAEVLTAALASGADTTLSTDAVTAAGFIRPLLGLGLPLLPLRTDSGNQKAPDIAGGFHAANCDPATWDTWLTERFDRPRTPGAPALGLGMRVGPQQVVVVDVDTPDEDTAWNEFLDNLGLDPEVRAALNTPTVTTPGATDATGARKHHGGGHWWFATELGDIPATLAKTIRIDAAGRTGSDIPVHETTAADGTVEKTPEPSFALMISTGFVVIPPTRRDDGPYTLSGPVHTVPAAMRDWLHGLAASRVEQTMAEQRAKAERAARPRTAGETALDDAIEAWGETHSWSDLLTPHGWEVTGHDVCGCEKWLRPGSTAAHSAIAHDGCDRGTYLQVFTDAALGLEKDKAYSKMQVNTAMNFHGDTRAALTDSGVAAEASKVDSAAFDLRERARAIAEDAAGGQAATPTATPPATETDTHTPTATTPTVTNPFASPGYFGGFAPTVLTYEDTTPTPAQVVEETLAVRYDEEQYPEGHPNDPELLRAIFDFDDRTRAIFHAARASRIYLHPMALLFAELVRAGRMSGQETHTEFDDQLSFYLALCARSGGSKSVTVSRITGDSLFVRSGGFPANLNEGEAAGGKIYPGVASGQALVDALTDQEIVKDAEGKVTGKKLVMKNPAVVTITEDELDNLAQKSGQGSTLSNSLLSAWSCGPIGDISRTHGDMVIEGGVRYSIFLVGGMQPARAASIVGRAARDSGLQQRLFFLGTEDPWAVDPVTKRRATTDVVGVAPSALPVDTSDPAKYVLPGIAEGVTVKLPPGAHDAMEEQWAHTALGDQAPGETHLIRMRIRIACLAAVHIGSDEVSDEMWQWAGMVMEHRRRALAFVEAGARASAVEAAGDEELTRRGGVKAADRAEASVLAAAMDRLVAKVNEAGAAGVPRGALINKLKAGQLREAGGEALDALIRSGEVRQVGELRGRRTYLVIYPPLGT